ncbi:MAG: LysR family transcriptional regulator [Chloroflexi bacterium]|uniref:LysR family transcriptional regulator n=1 Tax=Candidatus Chlorohelix allophototropha TaxID=3003348 RepID=A0A8T7M8M6_9CHLR|nr:LysR family transcriptional regulator [Chloroflexota bacterium]WJW68309.1 LysR family transcriptional regulator [Chloroflexota bacterium L227-S17]
MELQQLKYFLSVAKLQHFTHAAEELFISQSSLSRAVAHLEEELGVPLFERQGRQVKLNRMGQLFMRKVENALKELEDGRRELEDMNSSEKGQMALAILPTVGVHLLPGLLSTFRAEHPLITFRLFQNSATAMIDQLERGEIDLCISAPVIEKTQVSWEVLMTEEMYLAVPPGHRLANRPCINLVEVAEDNFISLKHGYGLRDLADNLCREAGFEPKIAFEGEEIGTARSLVAAGLGVALIPALAWQGVIDPLPVQLKVEKPLCQRQIGLAWVDSRYLSAAAQLFRQFAITYFHSHFK